jgi:O-antigen/teichoic acid export membrane protein
VPTEPGTIAFASRLRRLGSESLVYGLSAIVGRLLSFFLQPYYAHHFDPAENGIQSVVYSYIPIVSIALYLGMDVAYMRNAASAKDLSVTDRQRVFTMSLSAVALIGGGITAVAFATAAWLAPLARLDVGAFRFMMVIGHTDALLAVPYAHLRMSGRPMRYAALRLLFVATNIALNVVLIGRLHWGVAGIFLANVAANLGILLLLISDIVPNMRPALLPGAPWRGLWHYALPLLPATLAVMLVENGDRIVLNYLPENAARAVYHMTPKDVVGIYSFNYKLGVAMLLVVQTFRLAWVPFSLQHAREKQAPQLFARVLMALMLACSIAFLAISLLLPAVAEIRAVRDYVKPEYWVGLPIVPVILLGYVLSGMYTVVTTGLYTERRTHALAWIAAAGAALNLLICTVAAPRWGMVGVAWATPAAYGLMAALGTKQANRVFPVPFEWGRLAQLGAYVAVLFAIDRSVQTAGIAPLSAAGLATKVLLLSALPVILFVTGFFRHGELQALRSMFRAAPPASATSA